MSDETRSLYDMIRTISGTHINHTCWCKEDLSLKLRLEGQGGNGKIKLNFWIGDCIALEDRIVTSITQKDGVPCLHSFSKIIPPIIPIDGWISCLPESVAEMDHPF